MRTFFRFARFFALIATLSLTAGGFALDAEPPVRIEYYGEIGCAHCDLFAEKDLPAAERASGLKVEAAYFDILSAEGFSRCERELSLRGESFSVFPVLIAGNNVYQGNAAIEENLIPELVHFAEHGSWRAKLASSKTDRSASEKSGIGTLDGAYAGSPFVLSFWPVAAAGLVDGINPCAFATMLFFLSWISLKGGSRARVLGMGLAFIAGVFAAYTATGYGLSGVLRAASFSRGLRAFFRWFFPALALLFAVLSFRDAVRARKGNPEGMALQLPDFLKKLTHKRIRGTRTSGGLPVLAVSFFCTGAVVSVLELACTGQVYFPALAYMVQASGTGSAPILWLLLYNAAFILPLSAILVMVLGGISQDSIRSFFSRNLAASKAVMGVLFLALGAIMYLSGSIAL
ncbi:MAG TPA: hypothetical protein PL077_02285 [Treponemataceae bacterium]|nr:hypothetical protein [Treponemataceae bacterium]